MAWQEVDRGVYRAEFGGSEKIFINVGGLFAHLQREHCRVYCICTLAIQSDLGGLDPSTALKQAWRTLRIEMPSLGILQDGPSHKVYRVLEGQAEQQWLDQTFFVEPNGRTTEQVIAGGAGDPPSLHFLPSSSQVVFTCPHWQIDAVGTNWLLDRLFALLAMPPTSPPRSPRLEDVSPALEIAAGCPDQCTAEEESCARSYYQSFRESSIPHHHMPYKGDVTTLPGNPGRQTITLDAARTAALVDACKTQGVSITAAAQAALAQTIFDLAEWDLTEGPKHDFTCVSPINMRPKLLPPYNTRAHAAQTYIMGVGCRVRRESSFVDAARALTRHYKVVYDDDRVLRSLRALYQANGDATPVQPEKGQSKGAVATPAPAPTSPLPQRPPSGITMSSLGIVDNYLTGTYGRGGNGAGEDSPPAVMVRKYEFGINMMTRQMIMYVGTFQGRLHMSISYNTSYYGPEVPLDVLEGVRGQLQTGLEVDLDALID